MQNLANYLALAGAEGSIHDHGQCSFPACHYWRPLVQPVLRPKDFVSLLKCEFPNRDIFASEADFIDKSTTLEHYRIARYLPLYLVDISRHQMTLAQL
jgi:hypothetical protein